MNRFKIPAIVFGGGVNGLGVVRNLGRNGVPVFCVVGSEDSVIYSRFCKKYFIIPRIEESEAILQDFLTGLTNLADRAVLFSTSDSYSLRLSGLKEKLKDNYYVPLPSHEVVRTLVIKKEFYRSLHEHGVAHPVTYFPESYEDTKRISKELEYPIFVKPSLSQEFSRVFHKKGFVANSAADLVGYYLLARNQKVDVIFQEVIPGLAGGNMYGVEGYFDKKFDPRALFAYCRLRGWPPIFGNTCLRESIPLSNVMVPCQATEEYLMDLGYHGLMEAEWKRDSRDGVFKLLEINARQSMQNSLPARCGINLVLLAYIDAINETIHYSSDYAKGVKWMSFLEDFRSIIETHESLVDWILSFKTIDEWSFFANDDPLPWIVNNAKIAADVVNTIKRIALEQTYPSGKRIQTFHAKCGR